MYNYEIITYATHSQGYFDKLVNNSFGVPVTVLGWGDKWKYYKQRYESMYEY